ncbi:MAG: signal peptidase I [Candidatus Omnitrophica bacterium]|nr:signal peptidase I [Candidatus Omnitrophota bacterium]
MARYWIKEWIEPILIAFVLAMFIRAFFVQAFKIPTGSMRDTLLEGDRILVAKSLYWFKEPERGDVIVFKYPLDKKRDFIKRVIGKPNETLTIIDGNVYINGEIVEAPAIIRNTFYYPREDWEYGKHGVEIDIPEDAYFVLGDNSEHSSDSRNWGFVPKKDIKGKAFFIFWPPHRWKVIH